MAEGRDSGDGVEEVRRTSSDTAASPWAGDVPITPAPIEFDWTVSNPGLAGSEAAASETTAATTAPGADSSESAGPVRVDRRRPALIAVGIVAALACVIGALTLVGGGDERSADEPGTTTPPTEPVADSLPPAQTDVLVDTEPTDSANTERDEVAEAAEVESRRAREDERNAPTRLKVAEGVWSKFQIDVPPELANLQPTTMAIVTSDAYHEVQLPSGSTVSIGLGSIARNNQMVVGATSTVLAGFNRASSDSLLLRRGEPPVDLDLPDNRNDITAIPSTDEFVTFAFEGAVDLVDQITVSPTGEVVTAETDFGPVAPWLRTRAPNGREILTDGGGVYERREDGTTVQVSGGSLVSVSSHHLLVRECTEGYVCSFTTIDGVTGERRTVLLDSDFNSQLASATLQVSPDGAFARSVRFSNSGAQDVIFDLTTGASIGTSSTAFGPERLWVWTTGSEGIVRPGASGGVTFIERSGGELIDFGRVLGEVLQVGTRLGVALPEPIPPSALATGLQLTGLSTDGEIVELDVDTGTITTTEAPPLASGAPARMFPDADGALIVSYDNVPSVRFDAEERSATLAQSSRPGGPLIDGPLPGTVWASRSLDDAGPGLALVDALGREFGPVIASAGRTSLIGGDGAGSVMFGSELGGVFVAGVDTAPKRLTTGEVLAVNAEVAFVRECDAALECGVIRIDRATGERESLADELFAQVGAISPGVVWSGASVSPDGAVLVAFGRDEFDGVTGSVVIDQATGVSVSGQALEVSTPIIWADDSSFALFLAGDDVQVYDRAANQMRILPDVPQMKAIAAIPPNVAEIPAPIFEISPDLSTGVEDATIDNVEGLVSGPARVPY